MKTLLVIMLQEHGHLNPSFKVNRGLAARGWDVKYWGIPDFEEYIRGQGFDYIPYLTDIYPRGFIAAQDKLELLESRRGITARFEHVVQRLLSNGRESPRAQVEALRPDAMIVDINLPHVGMFAEQLGVPVVTMNVTLPQTKEPGVPPLRTGERYFAGLRGRITSELAWKKFLARRRVSALIADGLGMAPQYELARRVAERFHYPRERLDCDTVYMPRLAGVPELILCPDGFDFPRPPLFERHYVESIDLERKEIDFPWERIDPAKPLIFASMGSQRFQPKHVPRFLRAVVKALGARPAWQAVVSVGRHLAPEDLEPLPANVIAVKSAPQLALLRRAKLMITHGGLGSVKECIIHGVPMIVFPLAVDQPGNAARVEHHRIGLEGDVRSVSHAGVLEMVEKVLGDPSYSARLSVLRARFESTEREHRGADVVERIGTKR